MDTTRVPDNPHHPLTPGPLSTSKRVRAAMLRDWCTWDADYHRIVQDIRARLVALATPSLGYTAVLMQGSGTFSVEAVIGTAVPADGKLLVLVNGLYGERMVQIAARLGIPVETLDSGEMRRPNVDLLRETLEADDRITHVAVVHCETTTGMLNPIEAIGQAVKAAGKVYIVDAMSSFGGIPLDMAALGADFLISGPDNCLQGAPGFGFVIATREGLRRIRGRARSFSLDLYDQWREMEAKEGKWRFTSPTHVVHAFAQALRDLEAEGGVAARHARYTANACRLVDGMQQLGFHCLLPDEVRSPIITAFRSPVEPSYDFPRFYTDLKDRGFVIYPGNLSSADTFRIGTIGDLRPHDIDRLLQAVAECMYWREDDPQPQRRRPSFDPHAGGTAYERASRTAGIERGCR